MLKSKLLKFVRKEELARNIVFHGMNSKHVPLGGVILARAPDMTFYERYLEYLKMPKIHLGALDIAGLQNPDYDIYFAFSVDDLKKTNPEIKYLNHDVWCELAFFKEVEDIRKKESKLFLDDYVNDGNCEPVVDSLDLRSAKYILYSSPEARAVARGFGKRRYRIPDTLKNSGLV